MLLQAICTFLLYFAERIDSGTCHGRSCPEPPPVPTASVAQRALRSGPGLEVEVEYLTSCVDKWRSRRCREHGVKLVHGTRANLLFPMLKRTNFEMLNVLDLLKGDSCPMVGELENGIGYDAGVNLRRLDFVQLRVAEDIFKEDFWSYAFAEYGALDRGPLNDGAAGLSTDKLKQQLYWICENILSDDQTVLKTFFKRDLYKDNLLVKLSIAVTRLKLFNPKALDSDSSLLAKVDAANRRCFAFINQYIAELEKSISLCDDSDLVSRLQVDSKVYETGLLIEEIVSTMDSKLGGSRWRNMNLKKIPEFEFSVWGGRWWLRRVLTHQLLNEDLDKEGILRIKDAHYLKTWRTPQVSDAVQLSVAELTILVLTFPQMVAASFEPAGNVGEDWKRVLLSTLEYEKAMSRVLARASDPRRKMRVAPLTKSEKEFMKKEDIPIVVGSTSDIKEDDRNHMRIGREIDVLIVPEFGEYVKTVTDYLTKEFKGCGGKIKLLVLKKSEEVEHPLP